MSTSAQSLEVALNSASPCDDCRHRAVQSRSARMRCLGRLARWRQRNALEIRAASAYSDALRVTASVRLALRVVIPKNHLEPDTRDLIKLGVGLIGTMSALALGLLVASTKSSFDTKNTEVVAMAGNIMLLDRVLAHYGGEAADVRDALRTTVAGMEEGNRSKSRLEQLGRAARVDREVVLDKIQDLTPQTDAQRSLKAEAQSLVISLGQTRMLLFAQSGSSISTPFLVIVVFWLTALYVSFGLFAPANGTAFATLVVSALSVAGAMFLILDLDHPFSGFMQISDTPLQNALAVLGK